MLMWSETPQVLTRSDKAEIVNITQSLKMKSVISSRDLGWDPLQPPNLSNSGKTEVKGITVNWK